MLHHGSGVDYLAAPGWLLQSNTAFLPAGSYLASLRSSQKKPAPKTARDTSQKTGDLKWGFSKPKPEKPIIAAATGKLAKKMTPKTRIRATRPATAHFKYGTNAPLRSTIPLPKFYGIVVRCCDGIPVVFRASVPSLKSIRHLSGRIDFVLELPPQDNVSELARAPMNGILSYLETRPYALSVMGPVLRRSYRIPHRVSPRTFVQYLTHSRWPDLAPAWPRPVSTHLSCRTFKRGPQKSLTCRTRTNLVGVIHAGDNEFTAGELPRISSGIPRR